jgi:hypothetical protein
MSPNPCLIVLKRHLSNLKIFSGVLAVGLGATALAAAQPTLSSITPTSGSTAGGTSVTLTGTGFVAGASVSFGGSAATNVVVVSSTSITAKTPAHAAGTVGVTVTNPDGTSATLSNSVVQPVTNPGFESGSLHWVFNASGSFAISPNSPHSGTQSAMLTAPVGTHPALFATDASGNRYFPVNAGDTINFGGWARRTSSGDGLGRWKIAVYDGNKANPVYPTPSPSNVTTSTWTQQTGTYVVPTGKAFMTFYCELFSSTVTASIGCDDAILKRTTTGGFTYVSQATLTSISVSPANASLAAGSTLQYTATGHYSDGSTASINNASWSSSNTAAATINSSSGLATGVAAGSTTIKATVGSVTGSAPLTVTASSGSFAVSPRLAPVTFLTSVAFTAKTSATVSWYVDGVLGGNSTVGTISTAGVYKPPQATGTHQVKAAASGGATGTAQVVVSNYPGMYTYHNDKSRQGANTQELLLNPSNVRTSTFGRVFKYSVDGWLHAQPLYVANVKMVDGKVHNVLYVATEHDSVYAFDADAKTATPIWKRSFINPPSIIPVPSGDVGTQEQQPEFGITATPVIDPTPTGTNGTGTIYVLARTKENGSYFFRLHALDWSTGLEKFGGPVVVTATVSGNGTGNDGAGHIVFNPLWQNARSALLFSHGNVYFAMASIEDLHPYHGWVFAYNGQNLSRVGVWNSSPNGSQDGIWNSGGGIATDPADILGNVFVVTGNGSLNTSSLTSGSFSNTFFKLSSTLAPLDFYTPNVPVTETLLNNNDWDMTSGGLMLLPQQSSSHPRVMLGGGKEGTLYLVDRDNLGKYNTSSDQAVEKIIGVLPQSQGCCDKGLWSTPTYWNGPSPIGPRVYLCGRIDVVKVFSVSNGLLSKTPVQAGTVNMRGPTMAVSSSGTSNGILWAVQFDNQSSGGPAILRAWDANNINSELYDSGQNATRDQAGPAVKFAVPTVANGRVYFDAKTEVDVYGPLP